MKARARIGPRDAYGGKGAPGDDRAAIAGEHRQSGDDRARQCRAGWNDDGMIRLPGGLQFPWTRDAFLQRRAGDDVENRLDALEPIDEPGKHAVSRLDEDCHLRGTPAAAQLGDASNPRRKIGERGYQGIRGIYGDGDVSRSARATRSLRADLCAQLFPRPRWQRCHRMSVTLASPAARAEYAEPKRDIHPVRADGRAARPAARRTTAVGAEAADWRAPGAAPVGEQEAAPVVAPVVEQE